jgi:hypothetical protein
LNVIVIVKDDRVRRQVEQHLQELGMEDLRFATFKTNDEFQKLYFRERTQEEKDAQEKPAEEAKAEAEDAGGAELKFFSEVHTIIFALDSIGEKSGPWIDRVKLNMFRYKCWPQGTRVRMVMLKYEDDGISKLEVLHPLLDDLIYLPLDRLVFLQKMQILLTLPKKATPTFLFNQEVNLPIEISKISKVDRFSDVGLAIRNPVSLKKGVVGHFYLTLPGEKTGIEMLGKVFRSEPHPDFPDQFLVYFTYFGLSKNSLSQIRRTLSKAPRYQSLVNDDREKVRFNPESLFIMPGEDTTFGIAVIDSDDIAGTNMSQQLTKDMDRLQVTTESSYQAFLHKYLATDGMKKSSEPPKPTEESDFYKSPVSITVNSSDLKCLSVDPGPGDEDKFLGHPAAMLFGTPDGWLNVFQDQESKLVLQESAGLIAKGRVLQKLMILRDATSAPRAVNFKIYRGATEQVMTVEISPANLSDLMARYNEEHAAKKFHAIIIDTTFVPEEVHSWVEGLRMRARQVGVSEENYPLKFFFLQESENRIAQSWVNSPDVLGLMIKPVDPRQLLFLLSEYLPNKNTIYQFENLGWSSPGMPVHVAKKVDLQALSEFGASLKTKQKLSPGTMIYLRESIYKNAPNECLAARVYSCEEHPSDKDYFQVLTTYFGINDQFLKFARTWIRENYASQKQGEG